MESEQDVFEDALAALEEYGEPGSGWETAYEDLKARYAAAGKVSVPREVARYLGWCETFNMPLHVMFNFKFMRRQGFSPLNDGIEDWICDNPDDFARAWLDGWYAEEDAE